MTTPWWADAERVYRSHGRELWALFYAQCCDRDDAHDALHEAILRLHRHRGAPIADLRAWLLTVGRNWLRDARRRKQTADRGADHLRKLPGNVEDAASVAMAAELREHVRAALRELRPADREVLVLRYALGWSSERIAQALQSTITAVDMRLSRARTRLASILERHGVTHEHV